MAVCNDAGTDYYEYVDDKSKNFHADAKITFPVGKIALIRIHVFEKGTSLGAVALHLIDTDRFVKATTNNPNSSRSHTLIFVKLIPTDSKSKPGNIIIGDFAGVENAFSCKDKPTIRKFLNIKRDDNSGNLYYSTERLGDKVDPVGKIMGGGPCDKFNSLPYTSYIFENPVVRNDWSHDVVKYYAGREFDNKDKRIEFTPDDNTLLKAAISIIRKWNEKDENKKAGSKQFLDDLKTALQLPDLRSDSIKRIDTQQQEWSKNKANVVNLKSKLQAELARLKGDKEAIDKTKSELDEMIGTLFGGEKYTGTKASYDNIKNINAFMDKVDKISKALYNNGGEPSIIFDALKTIKITQTSQCPSFMTGTFKSNKGGPNTTICQGVIRAYSGYLTLVENLTTDKFLKDTLITSGWLPRDEKGLPQFFETTYKKADNPFYREISRALNEKLRKTNESLTSEAAKITAKEAEITKIQSDAEPKWSETIAELMRIAQLKFGDTITNKSDWFGDKLQYATVLYDLITTIEDEKKCREDNADVICENRTEEGKFINDSLSKVRDVISKILYEKNKTAINISPNFIDQCLDKYGSESEGRFNFETPNDTKSSDKTGSVIFDEIYNVLNEGEVETKYKTVQELYKDIIVSVFCVFNISRKDNNPPPVPYMDINDIKRLFFAGVDNNNYENFKTLGGDIIRMISQKCVEFTPKDGFNDKVGDLMNTPQNIRTGNVRSYLSTGGNTIFGEFNHIISRDYKDFKKNYTVGLMFKERIKRFIDMVDKSNAVSAIGTLEFVDAIAKYNAVRTVCNGPLAINKEYKELYKKDALGGKSRNTKRHKPKPKKNQTTTLKSYSRR